MSPRTWARSVLLYLRWRARLLFQQVRETANPLNRNG